MLVYRKRADPRPALHAWSEHVGLTLRPTTEVRNHCFPSSKPPTPIAVNEHRLIGSALRFVQHWNLLCYTGGSEPATLRRLLRRPRFRRFGTRRDRNCYFSRIDWIVWQKKRICTHIDRLRGFSLPVPLPFPTHRVRDSSPDNLQKLLAVRLPPMILAPCHFIRVLL